jgi:hypothetical protein
MLALACITVVAGLTPGCGLAASYEAGSDAGLVDAPMIPRRTLSAEGPTTVTVAPGAETTLRVRLIDDTTGRPAAGVPLTFAIEGAPRGSTLRALEAMTDADGRSSVILVAGPLATTFRVRVLAAGAAPLGFDVSVGTEFGELVVGVEPPRRRDARSYVVRAAADLPCAEVQRASSGVERTVGASPMTASFAALSTAAAWTVDVRALDVGGRVVARGCVEGVRVSVREPTAITVAAHAVPLDPTGAYSVVLGVAASEVGAATRSAVLAAVPDVDGTAVALLDALAEELIATDGLTALRAARAAGLDARLATELEASGAGWRADVEALADEADARFAALTLEGKLRQRAAAELSFERASLGDAIVAGPFPTTIRGVTTAPDEDAQRLGGVELELLPGALWTAALRASAAPTMHLGEGPSCTVLVELLATEGVLDRCDASCVRAACTRASAKLDAAIDEGAALVDDLRSALRFDATIQLEDTDGDLRADLLSADGAVARWEGRDGGASLAATLALSAVRDAALE